MLSCPVSSTRKSCLNDSPDLKAFQSVGYEIKIMKGKTGKYLAKSQLPRVLQTLHTLLCEDFLCTYRHELEQLIAFSKGAISLRDYFLKMISSISEKYFKNQKRGRISCTDYVKFQYKIIRQYGFLYS